MAIPNDKRKRKAKAMKKDDVADPNQSQPEDDPDDTDEKEPEFVLPPLRQIEVLYISKRWDLDDGRIYEEIKKETIVCHTFTIPHPGCFVFYEICKEKGGIAQLARRALTSVCEYRDLGAIQSMKDTVQ